MLIAIDYDKTWTADPALFKKFVKNLMDSGHECVCVTARTSDTPDNELANSIGKHMPIVYAGNASKRKAAERKRYFVDIWIDDTPETVARQNGRDYTYI